jgi:hypothetical protein
MEASLWPVFDDLRVLRGVKRLCDPPRALHTPTFDERSDWRPWPWRTRRRWRAEFLQLRDQFVDRAVVAKNLSAFETGIVALHIGRAADPTHLQHNAAWERLAGHNVLKLSTRIAWALEGDLQHASVNTGVADVYGSKLRSTHQSALQGSLRPG